MSFPEQRLPEQRRPQQGPQQIYGGVDLDEASRQLELAAHDIAVAAT